MLHTRRLQQLLSIRVPLKQLLERTLPMVQRRRLPLLRVLDLQQTALGSGDGPADENDAQLVIHLDDLQVLHRGRFVAHPARHLLAGQDTTTAALRGTGGADGAVIPRVSVRGSLA